MDAAGALSCRERITMEQIEQSHEPVKPSIEDYLDELVKHLVVARERRALSQRRLSTLLGLAPIVASKWESGRDVPEPEHFVRWAQAVGLSVVLLDPAGSPIADRPDALAGESFEDFELRRIALALKAARVDAGFTQKALASELDVSTRTLVMWEGSHHTPRLKHLLAWADRLGCRIELR